MLLEMPFDCKDRCTHAKRLVAGFDSSSPTGVIDPAGPEVTWDPKVRESEGKRQVLRACFRHFLLCFHF